MTKKELYKKVGRIEAEFNRIGSKLALEFEVHTQKYFDDSIQYWSDAEKSDLETVFDLQKQLIKKYKLENKFDRDFEPIQNVKENASSNKEMSELFTILDHKLKKGIYVSIHHNTIYGGFYEFDKKIEKLNLSGGGTTCFQIFQEDEGNCCVMVEGLPEDPKLSDPYNKQFSVDDIKRIVDFIEGDLYDYIKDKLDSLKESKLLSFRQFVNESEEVKSTKTKSTKNRTFEEMLDHINDTLMPDTDFNEKSMQKLHILFTKYNIDFGDHLTDDKISEDNIIDLYNGILEINPKH